MGSELYLYYLLRWLVSALALLATAYLVPGFKIRDFTSALIAAAVIGIANVSIRPVLLVLTLPFNILTLGLFTFVVDGVVLRICSALLKGFDVSGWFSAIFGAFVLAVVSVLLHWAFV